MRGDVERAIRFCHFAYDRDLLERAGVANVFEIGILLDVRKELPAELVRFLSSLVRTLQLPWESGSSIRRRLSRVKKL